jgi:hypothetical protein
MRWWWFGPSVTQAELERELIAIADAGLGGVEVAYVSPLAPATTEFGSDPFLADLRFAAERAHQLGLRFHLTLGSGWSFGGAHISAELAAPTAALGATGNRAGTPPWPGDELVAAYIGAGSLQQQPQSYEQLPVADGRIMISAGRASASSAHMHYRTGPVLPRRWIRGRYETPWPGARLFSRSHIRCQACSPSSVTGTDAVVRGGVM